MPEKYNLLYPQNLIPAIVAVSAVTTYTIFKILEYRQRQHGNVTLDEVSKAYQENLDEATLVALAEKLQTESRTVSRKRQDERNRLWENFERQLEPIIERERTENLRGSPGLHATSPLEELSPTYRRLYTRN